MSPHVPQSQRNTCVAACAAILLSSSGRCTTEQVLVQRWGNPPGQGYPLTRLNALPELTCRDLDLDRPEGFRLLKALLQRSWLAAVVFGGPMTVLAREHNPPLHSPHGPLCSLYAHRERLLRNGDGRCGQHVVVLCEWRTGGVVTIDPWHTPQGQPFLMTREWLTLATTGQCWSVS